MPDASSVEPGGRALGRWLDRLRALWTAKLWLTLALSAGFWTVYLVLSRHAIFPPRTLPLTWLDTWAGYAPGVWAWVYESNFLLTGIVPWMITTREALRRYAVGFGVLAGVSFLVFALIPVAAPRPDDPDRPALMALIVALDGPLNAFPSLHAGFVVYTLLLARRLMRTQWKPVTAAPLLAWGALILYATLATKQHYAWDLAAGALIGWIADRVAWHKAGSPRDGGRQGFL